jgi:hypothetical protein
VAADIFSQLKSHELNREGRRKVEAELLRRGAASVTSMSRGTRRICLVATNFVYSPKWLKGLTLTADWWHIDMRSIASLLGTQFTVDLNKPDLVIRGPSTTPGKPGPIILVIDPNENL